MGDRTTPPGWYPDPGDPSLLRWWDGERWTDRTGPIGSVDERWRTGEAGASVGTAVEDGTARSPGSGLRTVVLVLIFAAAVGVAGLWLATALSDPDTDPDPTALDQGDLAVFLCDGRSCPPITDDELAELEAAVADDADVARASYESKEEAYARFEELFADDPELVESVDPDVMPASYRLWLEDHAPVEAVAARYRELPGVDDAVVLVER